MASPFPHHSLLLPGGLVLVLGNEVVHHLVHLQLCSGFVQCARSRPRQEGAVGLLLLALFLRLLLLHHVHEVLRILEERRAHAARRARQVVHAPHVPEPQRALGMLLLALLVVVLDAEQVQARLAHHPQRVAAVQVQPDAALLLQVAAQRLRLTRPPRAHDQLHVHGVAHHVLDLAQTARHHAVDGVQKVPAGAQHLPALLLEALVGQLAAQQVDHRVHQLHVAVHRRRRRAALLLLLAQRALHRVRRHVGLRVQVGLAQREALLQARVDQLVQAVEHVQVVAAEHHVARRGDRRLVHLHLDGCLLRLLHLLCLLLLCLLLLCFLLFHLFLLLLRLLLLHLRLLLLAGTLVRTLARRLDQQVAARHLRLLLAHAHRVQLRRRVVLHDGALAQRRRHHAPDRVLHAAVLLRLTPAPHAHQLRRVDEVRRQLEELDHQLLQQRAAARHLAFRELPLRAHQQQAQHLLVHRVVRERELHVRCARVQLRVRLLALALLRGELLRVSAHALSHLDGVHQHLGGGVLLVRLAEVERAVVQRQVVVLLLDLADALRLTSRARAHLVQHHLLRDPLLLLRLQPLHHARDAPLRVHEQQLRLTPARRPCLDHLLVHPVVRVHAPDRRRLHRRQRVLAQLVRAVLLQRLQLLLQQLQLRDRRPRRLQDHVRLEVVVLAPEQRLLVLVAAHVLRLTALPCPHAIGEVLAPDRLRHQVVVQHQALRVRPLAAHAPRDLRRQLVVGGRGPGARVDLLPGQQRLRVRHRVLRNALVRQVPAQLRQHRVPQVQQVRQRREQLAQRQDVLRLTAPRRAHLVVQVQQLQELPVRRLRRDLALHLRLKRPPRPHPLEEAPLAHRQRVRLRLLLHVPAATRLRRHVHHRRRGLHRLRRTDLARDARAAARGDELGLHRLVDGLLVCGNEGLLVALVLLRGVHLADQHRRLVLVALRKEHHEAVDQLVLSAEQVDDLDVTVIVDAHLLHHLRHILPPVLIVLENAHELVVGVVVVVRVLLLDHRHVLRGNPLLRLLIARK